MCKQEKVNDRLNRGQREKWGVREESVLGKREGYKIEEWEEEGVKGETEQEDD